ncbi:MAG: AraC family transcriptional regulator [Tepidibacter sp.]|jgi:AraC-like DNA-binding protein|uniref:helix-turn-helix domain-containing protein n=1 Tax=Tepidibacter sp. TaxID=2529387 RepID=UPI0025F06724|nr:AraC family transcriptional regulator [Tepidibacter sp.]MCT4509302.1 AraC family transcriptional regulator [Tepidibacter sp.]
MGFTDRFLLGENVTIVVSEENTKVLQVKNKSGEGIMTSHKIIGGVYLIFNDFHMENFYSDVTHDTNVFCIDYCREGRIEHIETDGSYCYIESGYLKVDDRSNHNKKFSFPLSHYHGITIVFFLDEAPNSITNTFRDFPVDLRNLKEKYCNNKKSFVIRNEETIDHIFKKLYEAPHNIKNYYYKIKIMELLLYLDVLEISDCYQGKPYFYKTQLEKVKAIKEFMTSQLETHYTLDELSQRFNISLTSMKKCFKGIYGSSIYAYMKMYRMNKAAVLLSTTDVSITEIAGKLGYNSSSKFAAAFKAVIGKNPREYRKSLT